MSVTQFQRMNVPVKPEDSVQPGRRSFVSNVFTMFRVAIRDFRSSGPHMAAGIAYWTLSSLFPLALAGIAVMGFFFPRPEHQEKIVDGVLGFVPISRGYLREVVQEVVNARGTLGLLSLGGLLWTGMTVFSAVRKGINNAWGVGKSRHFILERGMDLVMLAAVAAIAFIVIIANTGTAGRLLADGATARALFHVLSAVVTLGAFLLLYRYVPNTHVVWRDVWLGAGVGALLFQGIQVGFAWFVSNFVGYNLVYGSLGALMAIMVWAYFSALALIIGAQVAFTYSRTFGSRMTTDPLPELSVSPRGAAPARGIRATIFGLLLPKRDRP